MRERATTRNSDVDGAILRRRLVRVARISVAAALAVPMVGLLVATRGPQRSAARAETSPPTQSSGVLDRPPTVARVRLSAHGTTASPVVWQVHLGADQTRNAVLVAYETYVGTTVRLAEEPDADDIALPRVALDPQLRLLRRALTAGADRGLSRRGRVLAVARVESVNRSQAVVVGCLNAGAQRLYGSDGSLQVRWRAGVTVFRVRLRLDEGRWKVYVLAPLPAARCRR
jgi:hypothetical protein